VLERQEGEVGMRERMRVELSDKVKQRGPRFGSKPHGPNSRRRCSTQMINHTIEPNHAYCQCQCYAPTSSPGAEQVIAQQPYRRFAVSEQRHGD
jgi:hypothetical protein